ncbi:MAG TPA: prephenate dehydrogenase [Bellilinea sp.]|nr:prephenate dehydrogenase [Bellilinea sp.]
MTVQLTVIGLNQIGVSIGLALKAGEHPIERIGSDADLLAERKALKLGAFDQVVHNLPAAVENADIVVLCLPVDEVRKILEAISTALKPGAVVLETSVLKTATMNWAEGLLPEDRHLLSFTPTLNPDYLDERLHGDEEAHADLFKKSVFLIGASEKNHPDAVRLAADFSTLLGAKPYFADLVEAEGLTALVHHLPQISAVALYRAIEGQPGWREARKIGGRPFVNALSPLENLDEHKEFGQALLHNSENTVRVIDNLVDELKKMREMVHSQDAEALKAYMEGAVEGRIDWVKKRQTLDWEHMPRPELPTTGQWLGKLVGLGGKLKDFDKPKK